MGEEKIKNKNNLTLICIIIILLIAVVCLCGYIFLNKDNTPGSGTENIIENNNTNSTNENIESSNTPTNNNVNNNTNSTNENIESSNTPTNNNVNNNTDSKQNSTIIFDGSKSINSSINDYTLSCQGNAGIWVTVDSTQKKLTFSFTPTRVVEFYPLNWTSDRITMESSEINFDKKIVDIFFGGMGQNSNGDTLFILMEDGTVEYIPIVHMFNNVQGAVVSYGKINGITDVAKFTLSSTSDGVTTLAIRNDGTFYDLWYALKDTLKY